MIASLTRYWFEFDRSVSKLAVIVPFAGVTAWSEEDAMELLRQRMFQHSEMPPIMSVSHNIDINGLDDKHVLKNMGPANIRGIWYPLGH